MKFIQTMLIFSVLLLLNSCATPKQISINKAEYHAQNRVAIIVHPPTSFVGKTGSQGILDLAVTPQTKYKEGMKILSKTYDSTIQKSLKDECEKIYAYTGKKYIVLDSIANLPTIEVNKKQVLDYQYIKDTYQVEQIQEITCTYGITIDYYGFIETDKNTFVSINSIITNIENQTTVQQYNQTKKIKLKGKWRANNYAIFNKSLETSVKLALMDFNSQF
ncbi:hypothetical protein [Myroides odoratus]|uniref:hypothetical protein n=1 Tax=Myroides odoratus TaxID=256 RepID=UPI0039AEF3A8